MDDLRLRPDGRLKQARGFVDAAQSAKEIEDIERQHDIGLRQDLVSRISEIQGVSIGKIKPPAAVDHRTGEALRQFDQRRDGLGVTAHQVGNNHRIGGIGEQLRRLLQGLRMRLRRGWRCVALQIGQRQRLAEHFFLDAGVVANIHRPLRIGLRNAQGAHKGFRHIGDGVRLIVPLHVVAHQIALHQRGVNPIDPGAPQIGVHRASGAQR